MASRKIYCKAFLIALLLLHVSELKAQIIDEPQTQGIVLDHSEVDVLAEEMDMDEVTYCNIQALQDNPAYLEEHHQRFMQLRADSIAERAAALASEGYENVLLPKALGEYLFEREEPCSDDLEQEYELAKEVYAFIRKERPAKVDFDSMLLNEPVNSHTCSAMALDFLTRYMKECSSLKKAADCKKCVQNFGRFYRASTVTFGSRQAAFNTIKVDHKYALSEPESIKDRKIQSLANYYGLKLKPATRTVKFSEISKDPQKFMDSIDKLKDGLYVIRAIKPVDNVKMESYGHTMVLIKGKNFSVYYDNKYGAADITDDVAGYVKDKLIAWKIPEIKFYTAEYQKGAPHHLAKDPAE